VARSRTFGTAGGEGEKPTFVFFVGFVSWAEGDQRLAADAEVKQVGPGGMTGDIQGQLFFTHALQVHLSQNQLLLAIDRLDQVARIRPNHR